MAAKFDVAESEAPAWAPRPDAGASGPDRPGLLIRLLDELDYGLMLVADDAFVRLANRQALRECAAPCTMQLRDGVVQPRQARDRAAFRRALAAAHLGRRTMLCVGPDEQRLSVAVVPVRDPLEGRAEATLLVFGKRRVCEPLSVEFFAREHRLSRAEQGVLRKLCDGLSPSDIAVQSCVALCTVRTQIASIRLKTGAKTVGALVRCVTMLPPIVPILS